jgi:hypothetical protein
MRTQVFAFWTSIAASTLLLVGSAAADPVVPIEQGRETNTGDLVLPSSDAGNLYFKSCSGCPLNSLRVTPATKYFVRTTQVGLTEMKQLFAKGGPHFVMVYHDLKQPVVTRIVVNAQLPKAR